MKHSGHRKHKHLCGNVRNVVTILEPERLFQNQKRLLISPHPSTTGSSSELRGRLLAAILDGAKHPPLLFSPS